MRVYIDFETTGLDWWRHDFHVVSMAASWEGDHWFSNNLAEIEVMLRQLQDLKVDIWAYNISFEMGVVKCVFPHINLKWTGDVQRLFQLYGGVPDKDENQYFSLEDACYELLNIDYDDHKQTAHAWLIENIPGVSKSNAGAFISKLPLPLLEAYNLGDTDCLVKLATKLEAFFTPKGFDYKPDMHLHLGICRAVTDSRIRGVRVQRAELETYQAAIRQEVSSLVDRFYTHFADQIHATQELLRQKKQGKLACDYQLKVDNQAAKGKVSRAALKQAPLEPFNIHSTDQLGVLFTQVLKITPRFITPTKEPSFKDSHLRQWGVGGELLAGKGKRTLIGTQSKTLLEKSSYDGRYHVDLRTCGTITGRLAGAGGLNVQGLGRRDRGLMSSLVSDDSHTFVSIDLGSGEPTVTAHFSQDANYRYACFDGVGKKPYWNNSLLMLDDIYLMVASVSPLGEQAMQQAWNTTWEGRSFIEQWNVDADVIKKDLKALRQTHKTLCLGLGYGMGPKKLQKTAYERDGIDLTQKESRSFYNTYWKTFSGVRQFADMCAKFVEHKGYLHTEFGYMGRPAPHKAYNWIIQAHVSGIMNMFTEILLSLAPDATFVTIIHDEIIIQVPDDKLALVKNAKELATQRLNERLGWSLAIRTGWVEGKDFYTAK